MGNGATQFGRITVRTTADLGVAIGAGALGPTDLALLQGVWEREAPQDVELLSALDAIGTYPGMKDAVARLLQDPSRKDYWSMARGHLGHLRRFAPAPVVTQEVMAVLERRRDPQQGGYAFAGAPASFSSSQPPFRNQNSQPEMLAGGRRLKSQFTLRVSLEEVENPKGLVQRTTA